MMEQAARGDEAEPASTSGQRREERRKGSRAAMDAGELRQAIKSILAGEHDHLHGVEQHADSPETDDSSSLSSHSSTLKSGSGGGGARTTDRLMVRAAEDSAKVAEEASCSQSSERLLNCQLIKSPAAAVLTTTSVTTRTPKDFFFIKVLGEGSFSTVYYSKEVDTAEEYAIKVLLKSEIRREGKVRYVLREKDIMAALTYAHGGHPFVIRLYCTFQDNDRLYFALAYAKHGELLDWLRRLGSFDEAATLFYASEILCALEFLHRCKVIHRDLKPENILVGANWHIMVSDFGTSKIVDEPKESSDQVDPLLHGDLAGPPTKNNNVKRGVRSSFVGTAHYISPEVLKSEDVGPECDYWALGAIIFQMISGQPPFRAVNEYKILKKILNLDYHFPDGFPEVAKDLVSQLLVYKPVDRLGSAQRGGIDTLRTHPFFKHVDWANIFTQQPPELKPYLPASSGEPAFYGEYCPIPADAPMNFEPGLNEAALHRLMGLGSGGAGFAEIDFNRTDEELFCSPFVPSPATSFSTSSSHAHSSFSSVSIPTAEEMERRKQARLDQQRKEHKYHRFVEENLILKSGLIDKKKGLFARRRMFLLTEGPHLYYVDPVTMHLKGEVPFSSQMRTEAKNFLTFFVHTPKRTYYLFDPERHAKDWCDAIDWVRDKYFPKGGGEEKDATRARTPTMGDSGSDNGNGKHNSGSRPNSAQGKSATGENKQQQQQNGGKGLMRRARGAKS